MKLLILGMVVILVLGLTPSKIYYQAPRGPIQEVRAIVTAYSEIDSCHYENCVMASGSRAYIGAVACPRDVSLGTRVVIAGKEYKCEDRTHQNFDGRYDIFMGYGADSYEKAVEWGRRELAVIIK